MKGMDSRPARTAHSSIGDFICCAALVIAVVVGCAVLLPLFAAVVP